LQPALLRHTSEMLRSRSRLQLENGVAVGSGRGDSKRLAAAPGATKARRSRVSSTEKAEVVSVKLRESAVPPPPMATVLGDITNTAGVEAPACGLRKDKSRALARVVVEAAENIASSRAAAQTGGLTSDATPRLALSDLDVDLEHADDPQHILEYVPDIYRTLREQETMHQPEPGYMERQPQINAKMRGILIDWLVDVHRKYDLSAETLFLCVSLVDRYLAKRAVLRLQLQLVGITALFIASKYEDRYPPQIADLIYITDRAYTQDEIVQMEISILSTVEFLVCTPTPKHFLDRFQRINSCSKLHGSLSAFVLELALLEYTMIQYTPSFLAATAIFLSNKLMARKPSWTEALVAHSKFDERELRVGARDMCCLLENANQSKLQAVRKKYALDRHHAVSKLKFPLTSHTEVAGQNKSDASGVPSKAA